MTFNFGFATDDGFYLAADRRRVHEQPVQKVEDTKTKLHRVNRWTYLTGAGFLYFVDDVVAPQALDVFGKGPQDTQQLEADLPRLSKQLSAIFVHVAGQTGVANPRDLYSNFSLAGEKGAGGTSGKGEEGESSFTSAWRTTPAPGASVAPSCLAKMPTRLASDPTCRVVLRASSNGRAASSCAC